MTQHKETPSNESADTGQPLGANLSFTDEVGEGLVFDLGVDNPEGFNEYGVRLNDDGSVDVLFRAMEPGIRNNFKVTASFLQNVARTRYPARIPFQQDHSDSQRDNVGWINPENIWFDVSGGNALWTMGHIPNTGSSVRDDVIADFTHDPPAIQHGSVNFDRQTVDVEWPEDYRPLDPEEDRNPELIDGKLKEFSLTPFPGGYDKDTGGLSPAFSQLHDSEAPKPTESTGSGKAYSISHRSYRITRR